MMKVRFIMYFCLVNIKTHSSIKKILQIRSFYDEGQQKKNLEKNRFFIWLENYKNIFEKITIFCQQIAEIFLVWKIFVEKNRFLVGDFDFFFKSTILFWTYLTIL